MVTYESLCVYWRWPVRLQRYQVFFVLFGAFVVHLTLGSMYTVGNMIPYITSYIRNQSQPSTIRSSDGPYITACQAIGQGIMMIFGGYLESRVGPRLPTLIGSWLMSAGVLLTFVSIRISFYFVLVTYGLMVGAGAGIGYIAPISCVMKWLPKWKALGTGVVVAGFGLSATIFNGIQTAYINPQNNNPTITPYLDSPKESYFTQQGLLERVPYSFLILGGIFVVMQLIGCIFLVNPPPPPHDECRPSSQNDLSVDQSEHSDSVSLSNHFLPDPFPKNHAVNSTKFGSLSSKRSSLDSDSPLLSSLNSSHSDKLAPASWSKNIVYNLKPQIMLLKANFYFLWMMFMLAGVSAAFMGSLYKQFGLDEFGNDHFQTAVGSVSAVFNLLGRILWGVLADSVSYKFALVLEVGMMTILLLTLYITTVGGPWMFLFWMCGIFFCIGGNFSIFPAATARSFGQMYIGVNYALVHTSQAVGSILAAFLASVLVSLISWWAMFFILSGFSLAELLLALCFRHKSYILLETPAWLHSAAAARSDSISIKFPDQ